MFILRNFLIALANVSSIVFDIIWWILIINSLISWVNPDPHNPIVQFLRTVTNPILEPIRRVLPYRLKMPIDFSPLIAILIIMFLKQFLGMTLVSIASHLA
ncbi:MAG: YggT family protein [Candidatus Omnitrophota bacterium]|nr:YggT family protein [Candidatus Omnitrophota bacterium]